MSRREDVQAVAQAVLGVAHAAASVCAWVVFACTGDVVPLGCAVAAGLVAWWLLD